MSAAATAATPTFRLLAPEFSKRNDTEVGEMIDLVAERLSSTAYGNRTAEAHARAAAHEYELIARRARAGVGFTGSGGVSGTSGTSGSISYVQPSSTSLNHSDDYYRSTGHGLALLDIRDSRSTTGPMLLT